MVISDRFTDATFAYQGGGRGFDLTVLSTLEGWVQALPECENSGQKLRQPDLTLWFDLAPEVAAARLANAREPDKFERESALFSSVCAVARATLPGRSRGRFARSEADQPREQVWAAVQAAVSQHV